MSLVENPQREGSQGSGADLPVHVSLLRIQQSESHKMSLVQNSQNEFGPKFTKWVSSKIHKMSLAENSHSQRVISEARRPEAPQGQGADLPVRVKEMFEAS